MPPSPARLLAALLLTVSSLVACETEDRQTRETGAAGDEARRGGEPGRVRSDSADAAVPKASDRQEVRFAARRGLLYREADGTELPLLALDSAGAPSGVPVVPGSWEPASGSRFSVEADGFRHVVPSPEGRWVAWETESVHDLLGVVPADGGSPRVLDFYFDSSARELTWAPGGRFLASTYLPPSGLEELRVYDAEAGTRLRTPWGQACRPRDGCRVTGSEWTGATTITVTTANGGQSHHEVDVSGLAPASSGR